MASLPLQDVSAARLPGRELSALAGLRARSGLGVALEQDRAWVRWEAGEEEVLRRVFPVPGVELFVSRGGCWYRLGGHLPAFDFPPPEAFRPLSQVLFPAPVQPVPAGTPSWRKTSLTLVRDDRPRHATALECDLADLARWADLTPTARLASLEAARSGGRVFLRGQRLPPLPAAERFWGERVFVPLGWRPEPALPEPALAEVLGADAGEFLVLRAGPWEAIPAEAFRPLSRGSVRLAGRGAE